MNGSTFFFDWEVTLMAWLQELIGSVGGTVAGLVTTLGEQLVYIAILGFLYWGVNKRFGVYVGENLMLALLLNPMIKNVFVRRRPYFDHASVKCLRPVEADADIYDIAAQGYSFPSGHSTNAVTAYGSLALYGKRRWLTVTGIVLPLLIGLSRVLLGVHYPTDVLVGWALGAAAIGLMALLRRFVRQKWLLYLIVLAVTLPGCFYCKSHDYYTALGMMIGFFAAHLFERRFVRFENTRSVPNILLRVLLGVGLFLALNAGLKALLGLIPVGELFLRVLRYALNVFLLMGVYPMLFRYTDRLFKGRKNGSATE